MCRKACIIWTLQCWALASLPSWLGSQLMVSTSMSKLEVKAHYDDDVDNWVNNLPTTIVQFHPQPFRLMNRAYHAPCTSNRGESFAYIYSSSWTFIWFTIKCTFIDRSAPSALSTTRNVRRSGFCIFTTSCWSATRITSSWCCRGWKRNLKFMGELRAWKTFVR